MVSFNLLLIDEQEAQFFHSKGLLFSASVGKTANQPVFMYYI